MTPSLNLHLLPCLPPPTRTNLQTTLPASSSPSHFPPTWHDHFNVQQQYCQSSPFTTYHQTFKPQSSEQYHHHHLTLVAAHILQPHKRPPHWSPSCQHEQNHGEWGALSTIAKSADVYGSCSGNHIIVRRKIGNSSYFNINNTRKCQHDFWLAILTRRDFLLGDGSRWLICIQYQIIFSFQL